MLCLLIFCFSLSDVVFLFVIFWSIFAREPESCVSFSTDTVYLMMSESFLNRNYMQIEHV